MGAEQAREAIHLMRKHVGLSNSTDDEDESRWQLQRASRWALIFLAESVATEYGVARMKDRGEYDPNYQGEERPDEW